MKRTAPTSKFFGGRATSAAVALSVVLAPLRHAEAQTIDQAPAPIALAGEIDLLRLVDLAARRLNLKIEYDANALRSTIVTLRLDESFSDAEIWDLTNQLLAARGFTSVQASGVGQEDVISIVKLSDAAGLALVEPIVAGESLQSRAGYAAALVTIQHRSLKDVSEAVKALLSKPAGALTEMVGENALLISDLRPRLEQILQVIQTLDAPGEASVVRTIEANHLPATHLAALASAAAISGNVMAARPLQGKLTATPDDSALVLVAPGREAERWLALVAQFDRPPHIETVTYSTNSFTLNEVAKLIEDTARDVGPRGSGDRWRIVLDSLGGLLIVTANAHEHERISALVERLNALPAEVRRPVRAFPIRNRSVSEIVDVLTKMLEAGVLEGETSAQVTPSVGGTKTDGPANVDPSQLQRSNRPTTGVVPPTAEGSTTQPSAVVPRAIPAAVAPNTAAPRSSTPTQRALTLTADEGTNTLIAVGDPRRLAQLEELLRTLDVRQPQVMIEVLVVSLNEGDTLDLGVELQKIEVHGDTVITLSSLFGLAPPGSTDPSGRGFSGLILNPGDFRVLIRALQTLNEGRSLNMPKVLVSNNQQANLDAVVQQPFVSTNASDTVATTSFGGFENAGTTMTIKPQIAKGDHLVLEYAISLSAFVGESSDAGIPPPRQQNTLQSVVTVPDGYTVVVGGIEITTNADAVSQVPLLGDIPWLGEVFKSRSRSSSRSRFFVFIRPTILRQEGFQDLKYLSDVDAREGGIDDDWPEVEPRIIR